jgi:predicted dehydrogenase
LLRDGALGIVHRFESRYERWRPTPKPRWTVEGADARGEGPLLDLMVHVVDQALLLLGPARDVTPSSIAATRRSTSWTTCSSPSPTPAASAALFTSATVGIGGPRLNVPGSAGAFVKHGMDPQEALPPARRRVARLGARGRDERGRLGAGDAIRTVESRPATTRGSTPACARAGDRRAATRHRRRGGGDDGRARSRASRLASAASSSCTPPPVCKRPIRRHRMSIPWNAPRCGRGRQRLQPEPRARPPRAGRIA